ncbi:MAG TPA: DUF1876 domain-containing protein [Mycobacterium sp.]|nr:DUF1876 domain-containing protein [Mycobacterium sp.]
MTAKDARHVAKNWTVWVSVDEHDGTTRATARLRGRRKDAVGIGLAHLRGERKETVGTGSARLNPADQYVPGIGDELAVARALADLSKQLLGATADDIEEVTHQPVTPLRGSREGGPSCSEC